MFAQENKFKEATGFYEPIVKKNFDSILNVSAIVLANLCVSYIMTSQVKHMEISKILLGDFMSPVRVLHHDQPGQIHGNIKKLS